MASQNSTWLDSKVKVDMTKHIFAADIYISRFLQKYNN